MANIELHLKNESLAPDEIATITGSVRPALQIEWLNKNRWVYITTRSGIPVVGRYYARMKLAGIDPDPRPTNAWTPNLSNVR